MSCIGRPPLHLRRFDLEEKLRIRDAALRRWKNHQGNDWSVNKAEPDRQEVIGIAVEWAVYDHFGLDASPVFRDDGPRGDGGRCDLVLPDGREVEIKGTRRRDGGLIFGPRHPLKVALVIFGTRWTHDSVRIVGWLTREEWAARHHLRDLGRGVGPQPYVDQADLNPMEAFPWTRDSKAS